MDGQPAAVQRVFDKALERLASRSDLLPLRAVFDQVTLLLGRPACSRGARPLGDPQPHQAPEVLGGGQRLLRRCRRRALASTDVASTARLEHPTPGAQICSACQQPPGSNTTRATSCRQAVNHDRCDDHSDQRQVAHPARATSSVLLSGDQTRSAARRRRNRQLVRPRRPPVRQAPVAAPGSGHAPWSRTQSRRCWTGRST